MAVSPMPGSCDVQVGAAACALVLPPCPVLCDCESLSCYSVMRPLTGWRGKGRILPHQWWPWGLSVLHSAAAGTTCALGLGTAGTTAEGL